MDGNGKDLVKRLFEATRDLLERNLRPLAVKLQDLEGKVAALPVPKDGTPGEPGQPGRDGKDVDYEVVDKKLQELVSDPALIQLVAEKALAKIPAPQPGRDGAPGRDGKDVDPALLTIAVRAAAEEAVAKLPQPKDGAPGKDGKDAEPVDIAAIVQQATAALEESVKQFLDAIPKPRDGEPGLPGKDATPEMVAEAVEMAIAPLSAELAEMIADRFAKLPKPRDGKDADPVDVASLVKVVREDSYKALQQLVDEDLPGIVAAAVAAIPVPKDGAPGKDGKDIDLAEVARMVASALDAQIKALPQPKDGAPGPQGERGEPGPQGERGESGTSVSKEEIENLVVALIADNPGRNGERGEPGAPGRDGKDCDMGQVERQVADAISARIASALLELNASVQTAIAAIPKPEDGKEGKPGAPGADADPDEVAARVVEIVPFADLVREAVALLPKPKDGEPGPVGPQGPVGPAGEPGAPGVVDAEQVEVAVSKRLAEVLPEEVKGIEQRVLAAIPPPEKGDPGPQGEQGEPGAAGRDGLNAFELAGRNGFVGTEKQWLESLKGKDGFGAQGEPGPRGRDGNHGRDGKDAHVDVGAIVEMVVAKVPKPKDGERGDPGRDGRDGKSADDPVVISAAVDLLMEKAIEKALAKLELSVDSVSGRNYLFKVGTGELFREVAVHIPVPLYQDVWKEGREYEQGDMVTLSGSMWYCKVEKTTQRPGVGNGVVDWTLCVKRGSDGRDASPPDGPKGFPQARIK